jgi:hypothetical protein
MRRLVQLLDMLCDQCERGKRERSVRYLTAWTSTSISKWRSKLLYCPEISNKRHFWKKKSNSLTLDPPRFGILDIRYTDHILSTPRCYVYATTGFYSLNLCAVGPQLAVPLFWLMFPRNIIITAPILYRSQCTESVVLGEFLRSCANEDLIRIVVCHQGQQACERDDADWGRDCHHWATHGYKE